MPVPAVAAETLAAVRKSPGNRVKVAVSRHRRRPARQVPAQGQVRRRADRTAASASATSCSAGTASDVSATTTRTLTGWQHGLSRRAGAPRPRHASQRAVGRRRAVLPRRVRRPHDGSDAVADLPAPDAEARAEARREARLHADVRHGVRVVQLPRDAADLGRQAGRRRRRRSRRACSATRCCARTTTASSSTR